MAKKTKFQWEADSGQPRDQPPPPRDRSKKKREAQSVEVLMDRLLGLSVSDLAALPITEETVEGLIDLRRLKAMASRGGLRRQRLRVTGLLRRGDLEALRSALPEQGNVSPREMTLQQVERWRDRLVNGGDSALADLAQQYPPADRQRLRQLTRQVRKDQSKPEERASKSYRELFVVLRTLLEDSESAAASAPDETDEDSGV